MAYIPFHNRITEEIVAEVSDRELEIVTNNDFKTNEKTFIIRLGKGFALLSFVCAFFSFLLAAIFFITTDGKEEHYWIPLTIGVLAVALDLFLICWKCKIDEAKIVESSLFFRKTVYWKDVKEVKYHGGNTTKGERGESLLLYGNKKRPLITFDQWMYGYQNIKMMIRKKRIRSRKD